MPVLRNPFRRTQQILTTPSSDSLSSTETAENVRSDVSAHTNGSPYLSTKGASSISIIKGKEDEPGIYKLSVVNDSGVYLPPSPIEKKSFWRRSEHKPTLHSDRTSLDEPFTISRESFDSYRRSFDISARSPVTPPNRGSLDSQSVHPRTSFETRLPKLQEPPARIDESKAHDDEFEEIKLSDNPAAAKKRGLFSRFGGDGGSTTDTHTTGMGTTFKFSLKKESSVGAPQESELTRIIPLANQEEVVVG